MIIFVGFLSAIEFIHYIWSGIFILLSAIIDCVEAFDAISDACHQSSLSLLTPEEKIYIWCNDFMLSLKVLLTIVGIVCFTQFVINNWDELSEAFGKI